MDIHFTYNGKHYVTFAEDPQEFTLQLLIDTYKAQLGEWVNKFYYIKKDGVIMSNQKSVQELGITEEDVLELVLADHSRFAHIPNAPTRASGPSTPRREDSDEALQGRKKRPSYRKKHSRKYKKRPSYRKKHSRTYKKRM